VGLVVPGKTNLRCVLILIVGLSFMKRGGHFWRHTTLFRKGMGLGTEL
jgi:hypothetical protein